MGVVRIEIQPIVSKVSVRKDPKTLDVDTDATFFANFLSILSFAFGVYLDEQSYLKEGAFFRRRMRHGEHFGRGRSFFRKAVFCGSDPVSNHGAFLARRSQRL